MNRLNNVHPGEVLKKDFLKPLGISQYRLAKAMGVDQTRVAGIVYGHRRITPDTAIRLGKVLGTSPKMWLGLQADYDLEKAKHKMEETA